MKKLDVAKHLKPTHELRPTRPTTKPSSHPLVTISHHLVPMMDEPVESSQVQVETKNL